MSILLSDEEQAHLKYLSKILTPRQKTTLRLKTFTVEKKGKILWEPKQKDIAYLLGISPPTVSREWKIVERVMKERGQTSLTTIGVNK